MKKTLVLLMALVLSASAVFAAVEFSGELVVDTHSRTMDQSGLTI